jgi:glyoxylate reductase
MKRVFVTSPLPPLASERLSQLFDCRYCKGQPSQEFLVEGLDGCVGLLSTPVDPVTRLVIESALKLKVIANFGAGYDNIDLPAATERGIVVTNTPDAVTAATAELTIALILNLSRRISEGDRFIRTSEPWRWAPTFMLGRSLRGRTLGIVGMGRIGQAVAHLAKAHGMRVVYAAREDRCAQYERLELMTLLCESDVVSIHCPLTEATRHLIGWQELCAMRQDSVLINTARGAIVDENALARALREGVIAGAALDVYEHEPLVSTALLSLETVVLAPHLGSATLETRELMGAVCVEALTAVLLQERTPSTVVTSTPH